MEPVPFTVQDHPNYHNSPVPKNPSTRPSGKTESLIWIIISASITDKNPALGKVNPTQRLGKLLLRLDTPISQMSFQSAIQNAACAGLERHELSLIEINLVRVKSRGSVSFDMIKNAPLVEWGSTEWEDTVKGKTKLNPDNLEDQLELVGLRKGKDVVCVQVDIVLEKA